MELYIKRTPFDTYIIRDGFETVHISTIARKAQIVPTICRKFLIENFSAHCFGNNFHFICSQDAEKAMEWIESILLANEMSE